MVARAASVRRPRPVVLLTDFGAASAYPGIVRAVIASREPRVPVIDLSHGVAFGAILEGAAVLASAWDYLPGNAVVVAVVDPGVGSSRRIVVAQQGRRHLLAPDNGLATGILTRREPTEVRELRRADLELPCRSATFHGRDVFAPVAAALAGGAVRFPELGPRMARPIRIEGLVASREGQRLHGLVVMADVFGNLVTNLRAEDLAPASGPLRISVGRHRFDRIVRTYSEVPIGKALVYPGSSGHLEIAVRDGDARTKLGIAVGTPVTVVGIRKARTTR